MSSKISKIAIIGKVKTTSLSDFLFNRLTVLNLFKFILEFDQLKYLTLYKK